MSKLTYERNHEPEQQGEWFEYTGFRFKDWYDIELDGGRIVEMCRPNADAWYPENADPIHDNDVSKVRLKPDNELDDNWHYTGEDRISHNLRTFSEN